MAWTRQWGLPEVRAAWILAAPDCWNAAGGALHGRVEYSKLEDGVKKFVIFERFADGREEFSEQEVEGVRWLTFDPPDVERRVARMLLCLGRSGFKVWLNDFLGEITLPPGGAAGAATDPDDLGVESPDLWLKPAPKAA
jgi:hypothetical protein